MTVRVGPAEGTTLAEQVEATKTLMPAALAEFEVLADEPVTVSGLEARELDLAYVEGAPGACSHAARLQPTCLT